MKFVCWLRKQFNRVRIVLGLLSIVLKDREGSWLRLKKAYGVYRTQGWHGLRTTLKNYSQRHYPAAEVPNLDAINAATNRASDHERKLAVQYFTQLFAQATGDKSSHVPFVEHAPVKTDVKVIAFYLPQYHPIPENDLWWGKGFTEWNNVSKAVPQFIGHYQPHLPGELGFYDLRVLDVQKRQMELARNYGIEGFCYHHYWFGGKKLLAHPVQQVLDHPELDLPFCLCWANENWTRRWDGLDNEVLIAQQHSPEDDLAFIKDIEPALRDSRYIRVNGRPLLVVYRVSLLPDAAATAKRWREYCINSGIGELYLVAAQCFEVTDPRKYGFDALVEFPPHHLAVGAPTINHDLQIINPDYQGGVVDYSYVVGRAKQVKKPAFTLFRGVFPSWDNEARKPGRGYAFANGSPWLYRKWLMDSMNYADKYNNEGEKLVFVNAWNEWGEGAHLEPDRKFGYSYLEATSGALKTLQERKAQLLRISQNLHASLCPERDTAIILHLHYADLWGEIRGYLVNLGNQFDLFVSLSPQTDKSVMAQILDVYPQAHIVVLENRGRDIAPFIHLFSGICDKYKYICKIHSKKSLHRQDGESWRQDLFAKLLGSKDQIAMIKAALDQSQDVGIIGPSGHLVSYTYYWGSNFHNVLDLAKKMGLSSLDHMDFDFIAGSMFWFNPVALKPLLDIGLAQDDFEPEIGQTDGTLAHAIERAIPLAAFVAGYQVLDTDSVCKHMHKVKAVGGDSPLGSISKEYRYAEN